MCDDRRVLSDHFPGEEAAGSFGHLVAQLWQREALRHEAKAYEILIQYQWLSLCSWRNIQFRLMRWLVIDSSSNTRHQRSPGILRLMPSRPDHDPVCTATSHERCRGWGYDGPRPPVFDTDPTSVGDVGEGWRNRGRRGTGTSTIRGGGWGVWDPISSPECEHRSTRSLIAPFDGEWGGRNHKRAGPPAAEAANP